MTHEEYPHMARETQEERRKISPILEEKESQPKEKESQENKSRE